MTNIRTIIMTIACLTLAVALNSPADEPAGKGNDTPYVDTVQQQEARRKAILSDTLQSLEDPTQLSPTLQEVLEKPDETVETDVTDKPTSMPEVTIKAIMLVKDKPPAAVVKINDGIYTIDVNSEIVIEEDDKRSRIRVLKITDTHLLLSTPDDGVVTIK